MVNEGKRDSWKGLPSTAKKKKKKIQSINESINLPLGEFLPSIPLILQFSPIFFFLLFFFLIEKRVLPLTQSAREKKKGENKKMQTKISIKKIPSLASFFLYCTFFSLSFFFMNLYVFL